MAGRHAQPDDIRDLFSRALSEMYRAEIPQYRTLLELVADVNARTLRVDPQLRAELEQGGEIDRLAIERHGAIRLGTARELFGVRRVFAVMGMYPIGYCDLSVVGVSVHSTAFRPITEQALGRNPFRVFTSLLRLDLIEDPALRAEAETILAARRIFTPRVIELVTVFETEGRPTHLEAEELVREALETFRWHGNATVDLATYRKLHRAHRLVTDIVSFRGPHINHLTPQTLDIDAVQAAMPRCGNSGQGGDRRAAAAQLSDSPTAEQKALEEPIAFKQTAGEIASGTHTARFGEIEQRGGALTAKGRKLYDELLASAVVLSSPPAPVRT